MLIEIDDKIVTVELFTEKFACDLSKCKGACCVEGDDGAPLKREEIQIIEELLPKILPYMDKEGIEKIDKDGIYYLDDFGESVTSLVDNGACAFATFDEYGVAKCSIELAYRNGDIDFKKPISCELFPIRVKKIGEYTALNYQQLEICAPGRIKGEKLGLPVYKFLKEPIEREFGEEFYQSLEEVNEEINNSLSED